MLLDGDFDVSSDRTQLSDDSEKLMRQPEFLAKLAGTLDAMRKVQLNQMSTFGKLMARIDAESRSDTPERLSAKAA